MDNSYNLHKVLALNKNNVFISKYILILCIPFFEPAIFIKNNFFNYLFMLAMVVEVYILLMHCRFHFKIPKYILLIVLYRLILIFTTLVFRGDIQKCLFYSIDFIGIAFLIYFLKNRFSMYTIMYNIVCLFSIYLFINFITMIIYPKGIIDGMYFLGIRTRITEYAVVVITFALLLLYMGNKKLFLYFGIIISFVNIIIQWVATAIFGLSVFAMLLLYFKISKRKNIKYTFMYFCVLILSILIVVYNIQNLFAPIIETVLKKDVTFSFRTVLWERSWKYIWEKPIFGHGMNIDNGNFIWNDWKYMQGHNQIIQSLYETGIIGTALLLYFMYISGKKLKTTSFDKVIIIMSLISFQIMMIAEIYMFYAPAWLLFIISYYYGGEKNDFEQKRT